MAALKVGMKVEHLVENSAAHLADCWVVPTAVHLVARKAVWRAGRLVAEKAGHLAV